MVSMAAGTMLIGSVPQTCKIVRQGVEPDIDDVTCFGATPIGNRNAPASRPFGAARHADVGQATPQQGKDLVAPMGWNDAKLTSFDEFTEFAAISG